MTRDTTINKSSAGQQPHESHTHTPVLPARACCIMGNTCRCMSGATVFRAKHTSHKAVQVKVPAAN